MLEKITFYEVFSVAFSLLMPIVALEWTKETKPINNITEPTNLDKVAKQFIDEKKHELYKAQATLIEQDVERYQRALQLVSEDKKLKINKDVLAKTNELYKIICQ